MSALYVMIKNVMSIMVLSFFIVLNAFADLDTLIEKETEMFKGGIGLKQDQELIALADLLTGSGLNDDGLYKAVEKRTKEEYAKHLDNPKEKQTANNLNALIRAYGSFGRGESQDFIVSLASSAKSRGVRNRAHRLNKKLDWFSKRNELMQDRSYYKPGQDLMTHRFMALVVDSDPRMRRWASEEINRRGGTGDIVYVAMANILKEEGKNFESGDHLDSLAWYCKMLAKYKPAENAELLSSIQSDKGYNKKLRKYARF